MSARVKFKVLVRVKVDLGGCMRVKISFSRVPNRCRASCQAMAAVIVNDMVSMSSCEASGAATSMSVIFHTKRLRCDL